MAAWTVADVRKVAPELADVSEETIAFWIDVAATMISPDALGSRYVYAGAILTAHLVTLNGAEGAGGGGGGTTGPVASRTVGQVSESYAAPAGATHGSFGATMGETKYGRLYSRLVWLSCAGARVL